MDKKLFADLATRIKEMKEVQAVKRKPGRMEAVPPIEMYSDKRIAEFERENTVPAATIAKVRKLIGKKPA
jgi:hypothetical protein